MNFNKLAELHKTQDKRFEGLKKLPNGTVSKGAERLPLMHNKPLLRL